MAAQDATPVPSGSPAVVTVLGHGAATVTPDIATVTIGVQVTKPTLPEAQSEATAQMTAVLEAIKAAGIDEKDIQTAYYSVNVLQNYDNTGNPTEVIGYQVSNQVNVVVRDLDKVGQLLEDVVAAGANSIYGITFGVSDPSDAQSQARADAVADAKKRAEELAKAAGLSLGRVLSISEGISQPIPYYDSGQFAGGKAGAPVQFGTTEVTVDVQVTYELV
ncbi:MAG TPA: SIMPL domain-containing protein [Thermomicrobiales bacterium]|nr:SIMPL domain-containing protein [Thermomicrobiales bacterium]